MRYEFTDYEWAAIRPMLPNKARGVPRVDVAESEARARLAETFKIDFDCTFRVFPGHNRSERQQSDAEVAVRARREEIAAHRCRRPDGRPADRSGDRSEKGKGRRFGNSRHRHAGAKLYHVVADLDLLKLRGEQAHIRPDRVTPSLTRRTSSVPSPSSRASSRSARNRDAARGSLKL